MFEHIDTGCECHAFCLSKLRKAKLRFRGVKCIKTRKPLESEFMKDLALIDGVILFV
jgi:hypothetical protein